MSAAVYQIAGLYIKTLLGHAGGDQQVDIASTKGFNHFGLLLVAHVVAATELGCPSHARSVNFGSSTKAASQSVGHNR
jgi:hypothetical protein